VTSVIPLFSCSRCYISLSMSIRSAYRSTPGYLAVPLALLTSAVAAVALATLGTFAKLFFLEKFHRPGAGDLGETILLVFFVTPSIAILGFVICFSILVSWHHSTSWRSPTFAFALGAVLVWVWAHDFGGIGIAPFVPGAVAWLATCWFLRRRSGAHSDRVLQA
jgi:hypothetical protein